MDKISELTEQFTKFPGVGPRQARRMVYYLLRARGDWVQNLTDDITLLKQRIAQCADCGRHFAPLPGDEQPYICPICSDTAREPTLMIVEKDVDLENVEKSGVVRGTYFVLGGLYAPLASDPYVYMRIRPLLALVHKRLRANTLAEVIIALPVNPDGEETARALEEKLAPALQDADCSITHLGRGLSTGSELEYADPDTIKHAFRGRY